MSAPQLIMSGQSALFEVAVAPSPGRRTVPGLRLRLRTPAGQQRTIGADTVKFAEGKATASIVLREHGQWEYQWQTDEQVLEYGTVFVRKTGFS